MTNYIDPGTTKGCAVAKFAGRNFGVAGLVGLGIWDQIQGFTHTWGILMHSGPAVWEMPQLYPNARREKPAVMIAKANDLIAVAAAGSACATYLGWGRGGVRSVLPRLWKGQLPKPITHWHAQRTLTETEWALLESAHKDLSRGRGRGVPLFAYVQAGVDWCAKNPGKPLRGYTAKITDLLDAVTLGLVEEGRLKL